MGFAGITTFKTHTTGIFKTPDAVELFLFFDTISVLRASITTFKSKQKLQNTDAVELFLYFFVEMEIPRGKRILSLKGLLNKLFEI